MATWTTWNGNKSNKWSDQDNWSKGLPSKGVHALIPAAPEGGYSPKIVNSATIDFTLKNNGSLKNEGLLTVEKEGIIQNDGNFINGPKGTIINKGIVINNGAFSDQGKLNNEKVFTKTEDILQSFPETFSAFFADQKTQELEAIL